MNTYELAAFEFLYCLVIFIELGISWRLYKSKNGYFKRLMCIFFIIDSWVYFTSALFFAGNNLGWFTMGIDILIPTALIPKVAVSIATRIYLNNN